MATRDKRTSSLPERLQYVIAAVNINGYIKLCSARKNNTESNVSLSTKPNCMTARTVVANNRTCCAFARCSNCPTSSGATAKQIKGAVINHALRVALMSNANAIVGSKGCGA